MLRTAVVEPPKNRLLPFRFFETLIWARVLISPSDAQALNRDFAVGKLFTVPKETVSH